MSATAAAPPPMACKTITFIQHVACCCSWFVKTWDGMAWHGIGYAMALLYLVRCWIGEKRNLLEEGCPRGVIFGKKQLYTHTHTQCCFAKDFFMFVVVFFPLNFRQLWPLCKKLIKCNCLEKAYHNFYWHTFCYGLGGKISPSLSHFLAQEELSFLWIPCLCGFPSRTCRQLDTTRS